MKRLNMRPTPTVNDVLDSVFGYVVLLCDNFKRYFILPHPPNFWDVRIFKFSVSMFTALSVVFTTSTFAVHIVHVIGMRTHEKMRRVYTQSVIASMAYEHALGYFTFKMLVRESVSGDLKTLPSVARIQPTVASTRLSCCPDPTTIFRDNVFCREPINNINHKSTRENWESTPIVARVYLGG